MTDREKLIELLVEARSKAFTLCNDHAVCKGCKYEKISGCHRACIADHLIANGVTFQQWIPVTERLPECGERVLVLVDSCAVFEAYLSISHKWVRYGSFWIDGITHWMPLPEPPKGENE